MAVTTSHNEYGKWYYAAADGWWIRPGTVGSPFACTNLPRWSA